MEEIVKQIITETCSHWIVADDKELNRVSKEIAEKLQALQLQQGGVSGSAFVLSKNYLQLYNLLCENKEVPCYVDYNFRSLEEKHNPVRDICRARKRGQYDITFGARGIEYGSVSNYERNSGTEFDLFKAECERMNLEFVAT